jgi:hypothetical protein
MSMLCVAAGRSAAHIQYTKHTTRVVQKVKTVRVQVKELHHFNVNRPQ